MQYKLPLFPSDTKMINNYVGLREQEGFVYYLHSGSSVFCHKATDLNSYRYILGSLVANNLCTIGELSKALGINRKNVERYVKAFRKHGADYFFNREDNRGQCHKMIPELLSVIQEELDAGKSNYRIAKDKNVSESAIAYHIKNGNLKKKKNL